jgi:hypothetical protein
MPKNFKKQTTNKTHTHMHTKTPKPLVTSITHSRNISSNLAEKLIKHVALTGLPYITVLTIHNIVLLLFIYFDSNAY